MMSGSSVAVLDNAESPASIDLNVSSNSSHQSETTLTRTYRVVGQIILLSTAAAALLCSIYTTLSCRFLTIQGISSNQSVLSLNTKSIGIFSYSTLENGNSLNFSHCIPYENQFWLSDFGPFFWTTQFAAFLAPCFGGLAFVIQSVEILQNQFLGNFVLSVILYLMASLVQGYTFLLYGAFDFCFSDVDVDCELSDAGYLSVAATALYYLCSVLMCFLPRQSLKSTKDQSFSTRQMHGSVLTNSSTGEEGRRSVRFQDPPVSQTRVMTDNDPNNTYTHDNETPTHFLDEEEAIASSP